jgi:CRP-like cAMP-binding protein
LTIDYYLLRSYLPWRFMDFLHERDGWSGWLSAAVCAPAFAELAKLGKIERYPRKCVVVREGAVGTSLFIQLERRIRIFMNPHDERRFVIGSYGPGTMFGEVALDGGPAGGHTDGLLVVSM